ncbi:MAG: hypothetical protein J07HQW1_03290, partial [Haloquadratum walsbyi J07HQW1]
MCVNVGPVVTTPVSPSARNWRFEYEYEYECNCECPPTLETGVPSVQTTTTGQT